jgi:hypothetical protein
VPATWRNCSKRASAIWTRCDFGRARLQPCRYESRLLFAGFSRTGVLTAGGLPAKGHAAQLVPQLLGLGRVVGGAEPLRQFKEGPLSLCLLVRCPARSAPAAPGCRSTLRLIPSTD